MNSDNFGGSGAEVGSPLSQRAMELETFQNAIDASIKRLENEMARIELEIAQQSREKPLSSVRQNIYGKRLVGIPKTIESLQEAREDAKAFNRYLAEGWIPGLPMKTGVSNAPSARVSVASNSGVNAALQGSLQTPEVQEIAKAMDALDSLHNDLAKRANRESENPADLEAREHLDRSKTDLYKMLEAKADELTIVNPGLSAQVNTFIKTRNEIFKRIEDAWERKDVSVGREAAEKKLSGGSLDYDNKKKYEKEREVIDHRIASQHAWAAGSKKLLLHTFDNALMNRAQAQTQTTPQIENDARNIGGVIRDDSLMVPPRSHTGSSIDTPQSFQFASLPPSSSGTPLSPFSPLPNEASDQWEALQARAVRVVNTPDKVRSIDVGKTGSQSSSVSALDKALPPLPPSSPRGIGKVMGAVFQRLKRTLTSSSDEGKELDALKGNYNVVGAKGLVGVIRGPVVAVIDTFAYVSPNKETRGAAVNLPKTDGKDNLIAVDVSCFQVKPVKGYMANVTVVSENEILGVAAPRLLSQPHHKNSQSISGKEFVAEPESMISPTRSAIAKNPAEPQLLKPAADEVSQKYWASLSEEKRQQITQMVREANPLAAVVAFPVLTGSNAKSFVFSKSFVENQSTGEMLAMGTRNVNEPRTAVMVFRMNRTQALEIAEQQSQGRTASRGNDRSADAEREGNRRASGSRSSSKSGGR